MNDETLEQQVSARMASSAKMIADALSAATRALDGEIQWTEGPPGEDEHASATYVGRAPGWHFVVASFSIESQGFPPGSRGYDGVARSGTTVLHLTRDLAERAVKMAMAQIASRRPGQ